MKLLNKDIVCIGMCGTLHLLINKKDNNNTDTPHIKAAVVSLTGGDDDDSMACNLEACYDTIDKPLKFNPFETPKNDEQSTNLTSVISQVINDDDTEKINTHLQ
jgi:hypothetical protein